MMRFLSDGSLDTSGQTVTDFDNGSERAWAATVQADGKIILAGEKIPYGNSLKYMALSRYNADGSPDVSFDGNGRTAVVFQNNDGAKDVVVYPDGSIIAAGWTRRTDFDFAVYHFDQNGEINGSRMFAIDFGYGDEFAEEVMIQPDGKIVVAGSYEREFVVGRYTADGQLDTTFRGGGFFIFRGTQLPGGPPLDHVLDYAQSVVLVDDDNIAVAGQAARNFGLLVLGPDGGRCTICGSTEGDYVLQIDMGSTYAETAYDMAVQSDGRLLLIGNNNGPSPAFNIARLRLRGNFYQKLGYELDPTFHGDGRRSYRVTSSVNFARAVVLYEKRIIVAGHSHNYDNYDFSTAVFENDHYQSPPKPTQTARKVYLPLVKR